MPGGRHNGHSAAVSPADSQVGRTIVAAAMEQHTIGADIPKEVTIEIIGARVSGLGPIDHVAVRLDFPVSVLYGTNGAGKTYLLQGIAAALSGVLPTDHRRACCELHVRWLGKPFEDEPGSRFAPWISILRNVRLNVESQLRHEGFRAVSPRALAAQWWSVYFPTASPTIAPTGPDSLSQGAELIALLAIEADLWSYVDLERDRDVTDFPSEVPIFIPPIEAVGDRRLVLSAGVERPSVLLGMAESAPETGSWSRRVRDAAAAVSKDMSIEVWTDLSHLDETIVHHLEAEGVDLKLGFALAGWTSSVAEGAGLEPPPPWCRDPVFGSGQDPGELPITLLFEADLPTEYRSLQLLGRDPREERITTLAAKWAAHSAESHILRPANVVNLAGMTVEHAGAVAPSAALLDLAERFHSLANDLYEALLPTAPGLVCRVAPIYEWGAEGPLAWSAQRAGGPVLRLDRLSEAEQRWARFAIHLADALLSAPPGDDIYVLIDEPERGLHRRAEQHLADGIARINQAHGVRFVIATHSPAFFRVDDAELLHVYRSGRGLTRAASLPNDLRSRTYELGLNPADLLQSCRCFLLVEGQHELVILSELIGDSLNDLGVEVLPMRGATSLQAWDAQLIERFTDVPIVVLVDNDRAERLRETWARAKTAAAYGRPYRDIVDELKTKAQGSEGLFLRELCNNLLADGLGDRYYITALTKPDIPEYLSPAAIAPRVPPGSTWEKLRRAAGNANFKRWMKDNHGGDYSDEALRNAASQLDHIPEDFTDLIAYLDQVIRGGQDARGSRHDATEKGGES